MSMLILNQSHEDARKLAFLLVHTLPKYAKLVLEAS